MSLKDNCGSCGCDSDCNTGDGDVSVGWVALSKETSRPEESLPFILGLCNGDIVVDLLACDWT